MSISLDIWRSVVYGPDDLGPVEARIVDAFFAPKEYTDWVASTLGYTIEAHSMEEAQMHMAMFRLFVAHAIGGLNHAAMRMPPFEPVAVPTVKPAPATAQAPGWTWPWDQSAAGAAGEKST